MGEAEKIREYTRAWQRKERAAKFARGTPFVTCAICGGQYEFLGRHIRWHGISMDEYRAAYPEWPTKTPQEVASRAKGGATGASRNTYNGRAPDDELCEFLTASLLGDGHLEAGRANVRYREGGKNGEYLTWKHGVLSQYFHTTLTERLSKPDARTGKRYHGWWLSTSNEPFFTAWHDEWYRDRKIVPPEVVSRFMSERAFAIWFCDDGCMRARQAYLYTMAYSEVETRFLATLLANRFRLMPSVLINKHGQPYLQFGAGMVDRIRAILAKANLPGMEYKYATTSLRE